MCYAIEMIIKEAVDEAVQAERKAIKEAVQAERRVIKEAVQAERRAIKEAVKEAESKAVILTTIENYREFNVTETDIEKRIREKFNLSSEAARGYMLVKSA